MANLFLQEPIYISVQDYKDSTSKDITSLTDDDIKVLIYKAQKIIDNYIWSYWVKFDSEQDFIFPIDNNGVSEIPQDIKLSSVMICDQLLVNWDTINWYEAWQVLQEKTWDRQITYAENDNSLFINEIPYQARVYLDNYKQVFFKKVL